MDWLQILDHYGPLGVCAWMFQRLLTNSNTTNEVIKTLTTKLDLLISIMKGPNT